MRVYCLLIVALSLPGLLTYAQNKPEGKAEPSEKTASQAKPPTSGAKGAAGKEGKPQIERRTPFGTIKYEDKPQERKVEEPPDTIRAFEDGDSVRFEHKTPFGISKWTRKISELDEMERAVLDRQRRRQASQAPAKQ